ncbi:MAG: response regulator, partial [Candidatus Zixiibacteriota bacterium]
TPKKKILWVDDEIESLQAHMLFLRERGYDVTGCVSGDEGLELAQRESFDLALLDEMMPGKGGLATLEELKEIRPHLPVVMITKSEEESLMDEAIGQKIDDYLTKPANPSQVLLVIKRILESRKIRGESLSKRYIADINRFNQKLFGPIEPDDWFEAARILAQWDLELDEHPDVGLSQTHSGTHTEWNNEFTKHVEKNYSGWMRSERGPGGRPLLSPDILDEFIVPELEKDKRVLLFIIDCMRFDQWMALESLLSEFYTIRRSMHFSLLPTATPYSRNAIFSGLFPDEIEKKYTNLWGTDDEGSLNRYEEVMLVDALDRRGVLPRGGVKYAKVFKNIESDALAKRITELFHSQLVAIVVNFLDIMSHGRSSNMILKEIAADEASFRSLMVTWFSRSSLFRLLRDFAAEGYTVILTTDHGSKLCNRGALAHGKRDTSTTLRYKHGDNLKCDPKQGILIKRPEDYRLPKPRLATTYLIAKEDFYFVYPNRYNEHVRQFQNSFQHGGLSLEEMVAPLAVMNPR